MNRIEKEMGKIERLLKRLGDQIDERPLFDEKGEFFDPVRLELSVIYGAYKRASKDLQKSL